MAWTAWHRSVSLWRRARRGAYKEDPLSILDDFVAAYRTEPDVSALAVGAQGNVRTTTCRGFTENEFQKIVSDLP